MQERTHAKTGTEGGQIGAEHKTQEISAFTPHCGSGGYNHAPASSPLQCRFGLRRNRPVFHSFFFDVPFTKELVFNVFLPPLVFEAALQIHWKELRKDLPVVLLLATAGVCLSWGLTALGMRILPGGSGPERCCSAFSLRPPILFP